MNEVIIYTDGSAKGNPGPGGYATLLIAGGHQKEISQGFIQTTNNNLNYFGAELYKINDKIEFQMGLPLINEKMPLVSIDRSGCSAYVQLEAMICHPFLAYSPNSDSSTQ